MQLLSAKKKISNYTVEGKKCTRWKPRFTLIRQVRQVIASILQYDIVCGTYKWMLCKKHSFGHKWIQYIASQNTKRLHEEYHL